MKSTGVSNCSSACQFQGGFPHADTQKLITGALTEH